MHVCMRVKGIGGERERKKRVHTRERENESESERNQESERERERKRERGEERQEKSITGSESQSDTLCLSKTHPEISTWEILKQRPPLERALDPGNCPGRLQMLSWLPRNTPSCRIHLLDERN